MIYLDNAATTKPCKEAIEAAEEAFINFANPSSLHRLGLDAEKMILSARKAVAALCGCSDSEIYFTSGGTESNNTVIRGIKAPKKKNHLITTKIEHPSVKEPFEIMKESGFRVDYIGVDEDGTINLDELYDKLDSETALVSVMHVNNETGTVQPIDKISKLIKQRTAGAFFHVDAVQSYGKIPFLPEKLGVDFASFSAHKINGIKGIGALYAKSAKILPWAAGGGQQKGIRSGTENVPGIAAFGAAAKVHLHNNASEIARLRGLFLKNIEENIPNVRYNGSRVDFSPYILNVSFLGIKAEILLHALESRGIYVSTGSACSSNKPMPSPTLVAMGRTTEEINGAVRFSFDDTLTENDVNEAVAALCDEVAKIRQVMR